jgi:hypothetical protein
MNADGERHRAQAAIYIQIAKLMANETSAGALRAKAENHLSKAKAIEEREGQIAKLMTNETTAGALRAKAENHLSKAKAIEEREGQITQAPSNCGIRRAIQGMRVKASGVVHAGAVKSAIQRIKELDAERASIFEQAKEEALEKAKAAVAELNALGLNYTLINGAGRQGTRGPAKAPSRRQPVQFGNFQHLRPMTTVAPIETRKRRPRFPRLS